MSPVPTPSPAASRPQLIDPEADPAVTMETPVAAAPTVPPRAPQRQMYGTSAPPLRPPQTTSVAVPPNHGLPGQTSTPTATPPLLATAPVAPPTVGGTAPVATAKSSAPRRRSPLLIATGAFALGGLVGAAGFGLGMNFADDGADVATPIVNVSTPAADPIIQAPLVTDAEPVAAVAQIIGPSVVQVETNFGQGSGVVYANGLILTNHHVIENASQVSIRTSDGRVFETEVLGSDARNDIAVLSAPGSDLPVATIGSSAALEPGQLTVAIGSPFQLQQTVTAGIVSSVNRPVPNAAGRVSAMIQTDAPINPGNSGGALANRNGELVGINASIRTDGTSNSNVGIGFAVPIDTAIRVAERIVADQSLEPGLLGVTGEPDGGIGVPIVEVNAGSGAEAAGLQPGDRVVTIEGAPVTSITELSGLVQSYFVGDTVELEVLRGNSELTIEAVLS